MDEVWERLAPSDGWEYLVVPMPDMVAAHGMLNDYGKGGWELVNVVGRADSVQIAYLKRKLWKRT